MTRFLEGLKLSYTLTSLTLTLTRVVSTYTWGKEQAPSPEWEVVGDAVDHGSS